LSRQPDGNALAISVGIGWLLAPKEVAVMLGPFFSLPAFFAGDAEDTVK